MDNPVKFDALIAACQALKAKKIRYLVVGNLALRANNIQSKEDKIDVSYSGPYPKQQLSNPTNKPKSFDIAIDDPDSAGPALVRSGFAFDPRARTSSINDFGCCVQKYSAPWLPSSPVILLIPIWHLNPSYRTIKEIGSTGLENPSLECLPGLALKHTQDVVFADRNTLLDFFLFEMILPDGRDVKGLAKLLVASLSDLERDEFVSRNGRGLRRRCRTERAIELVKEVRREEPPPYSEKAEKDIESGKGEKDIELPSYSDTYTIPEGKDRHM